MRRGLKLQYQQAEMRVSAAAVGAPMRRGLKQKKRQRAQDAHSAAVGAPMRRGLKRKTDCQRRDNREPLSPVWQGARGADRGNETHVDAGRRQRRSSRKR